MNKIKELFLTLLIFGFSQGCGAMTDPSIVSMEHIIRVVDEDGTPIEGADISITFHHTHLQEQEKGIAFHTKEAIFDGETPETIISEGVNYTIINVTSPGYWNSSYSYRWKSGDHVGEEETNEYSRQFDIILRRKENPRPLYVHRVNWLDVPGFDKSYGFDLEKGDWVTPHGKGVHPDFYFTVKRELKESPEYWSELIIGVSSPEEGLLQVPVTKAPYSQLLLGREAPEDGYQHLHSRTMEVVKANNTFVAASKPPLDEVMRIEGYWFRVRKELDDNGEFVFRHGKLLGPIRYKPGRNDGAKIHFTYFFTPDHSRPVEWNGESLVPGAYLQGVNKH